MVPYRNYFLLQRKDNTFLILDSDKTIVTTERTLSLAKSFIDLIVDADHKKKASPMDIAEMDI